jgi:cell wall-associated NlpC family hydrolase
MRTLHRGDHGNDVRKLQQAIATRARARDAPNHVPKVDGQLGPETLADFHYVCYLLGMDTTHLKNLLKAGITPAEQSFAMNPGKRDKATLDRARRRVAAHKKIRDKQRREAAASTAKRRRIVAEAEHAAANYRKDPGAYHYLAGGKANLVYLHPTPRDWRSDCSQFAAAVYHAAGLPSPASVPHEWASTFTMVKAPGVKFVDKAHRKPGMLGMYGSRSAPHHVEIWCGDKFIGHGSPPIDSLTPGEPDYYLDFPFLN